MIRRGIGVQSYVSVGGGTDADAQAFITAAGITDATQQSAINTLVVDLKAYGVWTKMKAIYPFVGATSSTHKWNLKDPRDLDAAFRLVFSGGGTHSSTGYLPNGTNGYADTFLTPSTSLTNFNTHFSFYSRTNNNGDFVDFGVSRGSLSGFTNRMVMHIKWSDLNAYHDQYDGTNGRITVSMSSINSNGLFTSNRTANNVFKVFRNAAIIGSKTNTVTTTLPQLKLSISARNDEGIMQNYSNRECAFASIGDGLTDTEAANLYTAVQAYQTSLSRNV